MHHLSISFVLGAVLVATCGCGSSSTPGNGGADSASACADVARAQCQKRDSCSSNSFSNNRIYGSEAECEVRVAPPCVGALGAQGSGQSPINLEDCVAQYPTYSCTDFRDNNPSGACAPPPGTLEAGAACGANGQCISTFCHLHQNETCGACTALPTVGAACTYTGDCGRNLDCAIPAGATTGKCAALVSNGGSCLTGANLCQAGLACVGDNETSATTGTCQPQANTVGAACDRSRKTAPNCDQELGLTCVPTAAASSVGTCKAMTLVGMGSTCGVLGSAPITGEALCNAGGLCVKADSSDATGICLATAADGAPCNSDATIGPVCLPPARCVPPTASSTAGICVVPNAMNCK